MIGFYITLPLVLIALIRLLVAVFNYFTRPYLPYDIPEGNPLISVLIPARNEEKNIGNLINDIINQSYKNYELVVYNDQSDDNTQSILNEFVIKEPRLRIINGEALPQGWLGKNNACYNLALKAKGDYLMFLDADVRLGFNHFERSLSFMQKKSLTFLTMFPKQELITFGEKITVPVMQWILLTFLPLRLVQWSKRKSLSAANGQMMMFEASSYRKYQWHEKFKSNPVEDILISRDIKRSKLRMATLLGSDDISCRMYNGFMEATTGFSKNICQFFGGSVQVMVIFAILSTLSPFLIVLMQPYPFVFLYFFSIIFSRMLVAVLCEQHPLISVIMLPIQQYAFLRMVYLSFKLHRGDKFSWKGRLIGINNNNK